MNTKNIILIFILSLFLRLGYSGYSPIKSVIVGDALEYNTLATNLLNGSGFSLQDNIPTPKRAPGYPFFLAFIYMIFGYSLSAVAVIQALLGSFTCVLIYLIARDICNDKCALLSGLLICLYPIHIGYTSLLLSEILFIFFLSASVYFFVSSSKSFALYKVIFCGVFLGFATLTRPTTILFPLAYILAVAVMDHKNILKCSIVILLGFIFTILPWTIRNYVVFKAPVLVATGGGANLCNTCDIMLGVDRTEELFKLKKDIVASLEDKKQLEFVFEKKAKKMGIDTIKNNPWKYLRLTMKRPLILWVSSHSSIFGVNRTIMEYVSEGNAKALFVRISLLIYHVIVLMLAFAGVVLSIKDYKKWLIIFLIPAYFNMHMFFDQVSRLVFPAFPFMMIFVSMGILQLYNVLKRPKIKEDICAA